MMLKLDDESADALGHALETCCEDEAFFEDNPELYPSYRKLLDILIAALDAIPTASYWSACVIDVPEECLDTAKSELLNQLSISDDNKDYYRTDGRGRGYSSGRGADAEGFAYFKKRSKSINNALRQLGVR